MPTHRLYGYQIKGTGTIFIGTRKREIVNTIIYYKEERGQSIAVPSLDAICHMDEVNINVAFPMSRVDDCFSAQVRKNVFFHVYANAFDFMQRVAENYVNLRRGELYKFETIPINGLFFLPEYVMEGIRGYDWKQHADKLKAMMQEREEILGQLESEGKIARARPDKRLMN